MLQVEFPTQPWGVGPLTRRAWLQLPVWWVVMQQADMAGSGSDPGQWRFNLRLPADSISIDAGRRSGLLQPH